MPISVNDTGVCLFAKVCAPRRDVSSYIRKASLIHRIFTRPSHLAEPNPFRPRRIAARWRSRSTYNSERRWAPPRRVAPRTIRNRNRYAHPRAPREYLCEYSTGHGAAVSCIHDRAAVEIRKCVVDTGTSTLVRCFRNGLDKQTHAGTRSLRSLSVQARSPR